MKARLRLAINTALERVCDSGNITEASVPDYQVEIPKQASHGDFSTNIAMLLAKPWRRQPREIATQLAAELNHNKLFSKVDIAGPGFINFTLADDVLGAIPTEILNAGEHFGRHDIGQGQPIQIEFVSANPTGPLHVGHGRGAAIGSAIASLLALCGYDVCREYYVNDAGRQMDILALSVFLRFLNASDNSLVFPEKAYQGDYINDIAADFGRVHNKAPSIDIARLNAALGVSDAEQALDDAIAVLREMLGNSTYRQLKDFAKDAILDGIRDDLMAFGVEYDEWFSEQSLEDTQTIDEALQELANSHHTYERDGAIWFRSTASGDEKDRVVVRDNGLKTYFASDIAYHRNKFARGFSKVINIWGADHHGYVARVRAALMALSLDADALEIELVQFASLVRDGEAVQMSTRSGQFVTLKELVDEVGRDAARFFYVMRRADQHLEFDLNLATSQSNENPVYYVQYAHARIASVYRQMAERGLETEVNNNTAVAPSDAAERQLLMTLARYPETTLAAAEAREPHQITNYLRELAHQFHGYYNNHKILVDDAAERAARLQLVSAVKQVIANGLKVLGISAPESM